VNLEDWAKRAESYDGHIRHLFPHYDVLHDTALAAMARLTPSARVLVVGAGTGEEASRIAVAHPTAQVVAQDLSEPMLERGRQKYPHLPIEWTSEPVHALPEEPFDFATLLLVLHFLPDSNQPEGKLAMLKAIGRRLRRGGGLVYADLMLDPECGQTQFELWRDQVLRAEPTERMEGAMVYVSTDLNATAPARNEALLIEAGFEEPVPLYQEFWLRLWLTRRA
jgi:tRNA (cmo5U34)-methyltransferase